MPKALTIKEVTDMSTSAFLASRVSSLLPKTTAQASNQVFCFSYTSWPGGGFTCHYISCCGNQGCAPVSVSCT